VWDECRVLSTTGEHITRGTQEPEFEQQNCCNHHHVSDSGITQCNAQRLRDGRDQVNSGAWLREYEHRTGSQNEHGADDRRCDPYGTRNITLRLTAFSGKNGDVFEATQRAH